jgi:hypothetical protein
MKLTAKPMQKEHRESFKGLRLEQLAHRWAQVCTALKEPYEKPDQI